MRRTHDVHIPNFGQQVGQLVQGGQFVVDKETAEGGCVFHENAVSLAETREKRINDATCRLDAQFQPMTTPRMEMDPRVTRSLKKLTVSPGPIAPRMYKRGR